MLMNPICLQLNLRLTLFKFYTFEKLGNIPGKHLEIPGGCSTKTVATLPREGLSLMNLNNLR